MASRRHPHFALRRKLARPAPGVQAPRPSGGECEPVPACGRNRPLPMERLQNEKAPARGAFSFWRRHPDGAVAPIGSVRFRTMCPIKNSPRKWGLFSLGGATRNRTGDKGFADPCLTSWPWRRWSGLRGSNPPPRPWQGRALPNELNPRVAYFSCFFDGTTPSGYEV